MAKKNYVVKLTGTYGKKGETISLDTDKLTERQALMLHPVSEAEVREHKATPAKKTK